MLRRRFAALSAATHLRLIELTDPRRARGQGTVEYIGMVVMVTLLVAAVAAAAKGWAPDVGGSLEKALTTAIKKLAVRLHRRRGLSAQSEGRRCRDPWRLRPVDGTSTAVLDSLLAFTGPDDEGASRWLQSRMVVSLMAATCLTASVGVGAGLAAKAKLGAKTNPIPANISTGFKAASVKAGSVVYFKNVDGAPHNAVGKGVNSGAPVTGKGTIFKATAPKKAGKTATSARCTRT